MSVDANPPRPRLLLVLAIMGFFYGSMGIVRSWSTFAAFTGTHEAFISAAQKDAALLLPLEKDLGTTDDRERVALRKADALWSRRGVLLPLAGAAGISAILILFGALRAAARTSHRSDWGRAAWQLGSIIGLPCLVLETIIGQVHVRDLANAVADLKDPISVQLREQVPLQQAVLLVIGAVCALYLLVVARYLGSARVKEYFAPSGREESD